MLKCRAAQLAVNRITVNASPVTWLNAPYYHTILVQRRNFGRSEISKRPYKTKKEALVMDDDYRQVFYKQISRIDRVFNGDERSGADGDIPYVSLMTLENYDEQTSLEDLLFGM